MMGMSRITPSDLRPMNYVNGTVSDPFTDPEQASHANRHEWFIVTDVVNISLLSHYGFGVSHLMRNVG
jgi:hypothetical protein